MSSFDSKPLLDDVEPVHPPREPGFPEIEELGNNGLFDDTSLGDGPADAIFDALGHYADDTGPLPDATIPAMFAGPAPAAAPNAPAQAAAPKPATPKPAARKPAAPKPAGAKAAAPKPSKPVQHKYDWDKVREATDDPADPYDIRWISKLPDAVRASIDGTFADGKLDARVAKATNSDKELKKLQAQKKQAVAASRKAAAAEMGISETSVFLAPPSSPFQDNRNPTIARAEDEWDAKIAAREDQVRHITETNTSAGGRSQSVATPDGAKIRNADGQTLARANLMHDFTDLSKDPEKVKAHFQSMRAVKGNKNQIMAGSAAERFDAARTAFEEAHPGFTIPTSGNAFATRGLHQQRTNVGHLGHALGLAVDLDAVANPNLKGHDGEVNGVNSYMLGKFGRDRSKGDKPSRTEINAVSEDEIEAMGKHTAGTLAASADDKTADAQKEQKLKDQFAEISATSQRFKGDISLGKEAMDDLREKRVMYFEQREDEKQLAKFEKRLKAKPDDPELLAEKNRLDSNINDSKQLIEETLKGRFDGFRTELQTELEKNNLKPATTQKEIEDKEKERKIIQQAHDNFSDPQRVFGDSERNKKTGALQPHLEVSNVPIMQYLEKGFLRDDSDQYSNPGSGKKPREVFNADTVAMLARFGFNPGSKFGDTMHFDFIEGYSDLIVGGRKAAENMRMDRASPENALPPSTAGSPVNPLPPTVRAPTPPRSPLSLPPEPMPPIWQVPLSQP